MNKQEQRSRPALGDRLSLLIQELRRRRGVRGDRPLLRIDNRKEASEAPFQFDSAVGTLHRRGCRAIPRSSRTALYGLWQTGPEAEKIACPICRPVAERASGRAARGKARSSGQGGRPKSANGNGAGSQTDAGSVASEVLYGLASIVDQFGGVLLERGREFQRTREGRQLRSALENLYENLGSREKDLLAFIASALDDMVNTIRDLNRDLNDEADKEGGGNAPLSDASHGRYSNGSQA